MKLFLIWNLSLAILLGFANQEIQLFGMIIIGIAAWPAWYILTKWVATNVATAVEKHVWQQVEAIVSASRSSQEERPSDHGAGSQDTRAAHQ